MRLNVVTISELLTKLPNLSMEMRMTAKLENIQEIGSVWLYIRFLKRTTFNRILGQSLGQKFWDSLHAQNMIFSLTLANGD